MEVVGRAVDPKEQLVILSEQLKVRVNHRICSAGNCNSVDTSRRSTCSGAAVSVYRNRALAEFRSFYFCRYTRMNQEKGYA